MSDDNPYQSPQHYGPPEDSPPVAGVGEGVWRQGTLMVMRKGAVLPDRCVMSNAPAHGLGIIRSYHWLSPWLFLACYACVPVLGVVPLLLIEFGWKALLFGSLAALSGIMIGFFCSVRLTRTAVIELPISSQQHAKRRRRVIVGRALFLAAFGVGVAVFILSAVDWIPPGPANVLEPVTMVLAAGVVLIAGLVERFAPSLPLVWRIANGHVWLKGVHPDYLAELPEWPGK